jgi:membrane protein DedA with SNARE-associated domain
VTDLHALISTHGYWIVAVTIGLESMGLPLPGEATLIAAAVYAGATHRLDIMLVIVMAILGGIVGDSVGFYLGRRFGRGLLLRHGPVIGLNASRIKLGQFLFQRHGGKIVLFGRFMTVLRLLAAWLAGINGMDWRRFAAFNAAGATVWACGYGVAAYVFGTRIDEIARPFAVAMTIAGAGALVAAAAFIRRHEAALEAKAERALPDSLLRIPEPGR